VEFRLRQGYGGHAEALEWLRATAIVGKFLKISEGLP
jgi:hypothetical protein